MNVEFTRKDHRKYLTNLQSGDVDALSKLIELYGGQVFHFALKFVKTKSIAEEICQDVFVQIWSKRNTLQPERNFGGYIYTITKNKCLNYLKSRSNKDRQVFELVEGGIGPHPTPEEILLSNEACESIRMAIQSLSPRRKEIFVLSRERGFSHQEIAEQLGISVNTVKVSISKATSHIKDFLQRNPSATLHSLFILIGISHFVLGHWSA